MDDWGDQLVSEGGREGWREEYERKEGGWEGWREREDGREGRWISQQYDPAQHQPVPMVFRLTGREAGGGGLLCSWGGALLSTSVALDTLVP